MRTLSIAQTGSLFASTTLVLALAACGAPKNDETSATSPSTTQSNTTDDTDTDTDPSASDTGTSNDPSMGSMTTASDDTTTTDATASATAGVFIIDPDGGGVSNECDVWAQDCPKGEKCMPWDNAGGNSWNATRCSPLDAAPDAVGDACTVEGSGVSGIDSCDIGSMCWAVDGETNMGTCVGFCMGTEAAPVCPDPATGCSITNNGVLILCLPYCDPLLQDCGTEEACYPEPNGFFCSPDAGGETGGFGDPCEFLNVCDPGLFCADAATVPNCMGSTGCCSEYCDTSDPAATCMGQGQECTPFYDAGQAPPGYENVGICIIPQ
ncbi:MAG: ribulose phosphate epimerase [Deltaproteobacteria bacterium]|nr:ribulose phosphate epimerase [Deltaproteobacteria bacterium]